MKYGLINQDLTVNYDKYVKVAMDHYSENVSSVSLTAVMAFRCMSICNEIPINVMLDREEVSRALERAGFSYIPVSVSNSSYYEPHFNTSSITCPRIPSPIPDVV